MRSGDTIFCDQYSHASIVDGAILAKSKTVFFRHNNPMDLERKLNRVRGKKLVVVEGVYSMDGDVCVLPEIVEVAKRHGARILIDEAHSTFLFGPNGRGVAEHFGLDEEVDFHLGTFSKSLGGQGGFVCGSQDLIDYVNAFGRSRFFSCNLAPPLAAGLLAGLRIVEDEPQLRAKLWSNVAYLRRRFAEEGIDIGKSTSQVMPVLVNNDAKVFAIAEKIQDRGLFLQPVTYPGRAQAQVAAAHLGLGRAQRGRAGDGGGRDRGRAARRRDMPELTRYGFRDAISGFFEFPTENARRILPAHLEPVELHHGSSIFSMTAFDFTESMVGPYGEVVMSVIVAPLVKPGERLPKSAFYPYLVGTTTKAAREHAIERWHLPHWMEDVEMALRRASGATGHGPRGRGRRAGGGADDQRLLLAPGLAPLPVLHEGRRRGLPGQDPHGGRARASTRRRRAASASTTTPSTRTSSSPRSARSRSASCGCATGMQTFDPLIQLETA